MTRVCVKLSEHWISECKKKKIASDLTTDGLIPGFCPLLLRVFTVLLYFQSITHAMQRRVYLLCLLWVVARAVKLLMFVQRHGQIYGRNRRRLLLLLLLLSGCRMWQLSHRERRCWWCGMMIGSLVHWRDVNCEKKEKIGFSKVQIHAGNVHRAQGNKKQ